MHSKSNVTFYLTVDRQCAGQMATSCEVLNVAGGCNDPEAFMAQRAGARMQVDCKQPPEAQEKRSMARSRSVLDVLRLALNSG